MCTPSVNSISSCTELNRVSSSALLTLALVMIDLVEQRRRQASAELRDTFVAMLEDDPLARSG